MADFRTSGAPFIVAYRASTVDTILSSDSKTRLKPSAIPPWIATINAVERHVCRWFDALEGGKGRPELEQLVRQIRWPCRWATPLDQLQFNLHLKDRAAGFHLMSPISPLLLATYGYGGYIARRKNWAVIEEPGTGLSVAIANIPTACFLGVVPGVLRCSLFSEPGSILGSEGVWLDTRAATGSLAKIELGPAEEVNTVLLWDNAGDDMSPLWNTCHLLAFSCRPIGFFQRLVRWDQVVGGEDIKEEDA